MTEMELKIDEEVGLETEQERVTYLKFVNLGRGLESEARKRDGSFAKADVAAALEEVFAVLKDIGDRQALVEKVDEDEALAAVTAKASTDGAEVLKACTDLIDNVDLKHTALIHERDSKLKAIKEKWA